jgi:hypothetical protein
MRQSVTPTEVLQQVSKSRRSEGWTVGELSEKMGIAPYALGRALERLAARNFVVVERQVWGENHRYCMATSAERTVLGKNWDDEMTGYDALLTSVMRLNYPRGPRDGIPIIRRAGGSNEQQEGEGAADAAEARGDQPAGDGAGGERAEDVPHVQEDGRGGGVRPAGAEDAAPA